MKVDWSGNGFEFGQEDIDEALDVLGFLPEELTVLVNHCQDRADLFHELADIVPEYTDFDRERCRAISGYWRRRALRWRELEAKLDHDIEEVDQEEERANAE